MTTRRKATIGNTAAVSVYVRFNVALIERVDRARATIAASGVVARAKPTRSEAIRAMVLLGLEELERRSEATRFDVGSAR